MHDQMHGHISLITATFALFSLVLFILKTSNIGEFSGINAWNLSKNPARNITSLT